MAKKSHSRRILTAGERGADSLFRRMNATLEELDPGEHLRAYAARRDQVVATKVAEISALVAGFDGFDIIELMRQRETPFTLTGYEESQFDGMAAFIEIVASMVLARGARNASEREPPETAPNQVIEQLHSLVSTILTVGTLFLLAEGEKGGYGPLTRLASEYLVSELNIRGKQYVHIHDDFNQRLFGANSPGGLLRNSAGFEFDDFVKVRDAIRELYIDKFFNAGDQLRAVVSDSGEGEHQDPALVDLGITAAEDMFVRPGRRASFTAAEIAERTEIPVAQVSAILDKFSIAFSRGDATASVLDFLDGTSPFSHIGLISDDDGKYLTLHSPIGTDCFRQVLEDSLKADSRAWHRYDRHRTAVSEGLTVQYLESLFAVPVAHTQLKYFRPREGVDASALSSKAVGITDLADVAEADALFLIEDVAVCVEVKGRSISTRARQGRVQKLAEDLETTVGEASSQARRLERLIKENGGIWLENRKWLDLSRVREIRSIAVCLDDLGVLGVAVDELIRSGVITDSRYPWVVSLHDLAVISEVLDRPTEFLLYLQRRTDPGVAKYFLGADELDLFMLFLQGGLYVEPNPDKVYALYPASGKPAREARERYRAQSMPTRVHTYTDPLDAWIYFREGASLEEVSKPVFSTTNEVLDIVDFLYEGHKPGWFRFGADLLALSSDAQDLVTEKIKNVVSSTRADHEWHTVAYAFAGYDGFSSVFVCSRPRGMSRQDAISRMRTYVIAKKHQLRSDRALGVMVNEEAEIVAVLYENSIPGNDPELDKLGGTLGLQPVQTLKVGKYGSRRAAQRARSRKKRGR